MVLKKSLKHKELNVTELKLQCELDIFDFESTSTIKPIEGIVGQERAIKALKIGVELRSPGYNIFVTGLSGTGKASTIKKMLEAMSPKCKSLKDYAYVNNFSDPDRPLLLVFDAGKGLQFKKDVAEAIKFLIEKIPSTLDGEPFNSQRKKLVKDFGKQQEQLLGGFEEQLKQENFALGQIKVGDLTRPEILVIVENQPLYIQQVEELVHEGKISKDDFKNIAKSYSKYQEKLHTLFKEGLKISQDFQKRISTLEMETVEILVEGILSSIIDEYKDEKVTSHISEMKLNILGNLDVFKGLKSSQTTTDGGLEIDYFKEYEVNLILDNTHTKECPVIVETTPSFNNLFGTIEKFSDGKGGWYADFSRIKSGSLLRANGGYLVINAMDAFSEPGVWRSLKRVLLYGILEIQDYYNIYQFAPSILKPEPIEINTKVIFIGNQNIYYMLSAYEDDFNKIFKIRADFDYEMTRNEKSMIEYSRVIKKLIENEKLLEFDKSAIATLIEIGARYAGRQDKLTTRFAAIADIAREANYWALDEGEKVVSEYHINQAFKLAKERQGLYESKLNEMIKENILLIDTDGERVGQINGLAVYGSDLNSFGKPVRITAAISLGNGNIINVEREAGLSGSTHNKGMLIIAGYFREKFGQKIPLSFAASIVFEQGYSQIDGDSASSTEICVLLSCLSGLPIKQSIAITGSVNQKGDIQPIGGVNEKIEGFFDMCEKRGLNGSHGVIIPFQNVKDLMLKDEVLNAVKSKKFHIYPVKRIEEAAEILIGVEAGKENSKGHYESGTIYGLVEKKLVEFYHKQRHKKEPNADNQNKENTKSIPSKKRTPSKKK